VPALNGLPFSLQILLSVLFGLAALGAAFSGYFKKGSAAVQADTPATAAILSATISDMGAIRHLSDTVIRLDGAVQTLTKTIEEATHHERNNIEVARELCARMRTLAEIMERQH
jgi:hypothetical protein